MNRRKKVMAAAAGLIAAGTLAVGVGTTPAHAATAAGTGWTPAYILSQRNSQCAYWSADNHLAPIISEGCTGKTWWYCRVLNNDEWNVPGDAYECVDQNKSYMFGESGGAFKMETDNTDSYIQDTGGTGGGYQQLEYYSDDNFFASGPAGSALGVEATEPDGYGWYLSV